MPEEHAGIVLKARLRQDGLMIIAAPNGARRTKTDHPNLPMTIDEIAKESAACAEAGASVLHIHVRDSQGRHVLDAGLYRRAIKAIKKTSGRDVIVQITTEAVGRYSRHEQMALVREVRPEAVSLVVRELVPDQDAEREAAEFFKWLKRANIWPQFIVFSAEEVTRFLTLIKRGIIPFDPASLLFVLGRYEGVNATPEDLTPFLEALGDTDHIWSVCAFGPAELACLARAISHGGHTRTGLENNLHLPDGSLAASTAELIACVVGEAAQFGRIVWQAVDARRFP